MNRADVVGEPSLGDSLLQEDRLSVSLMTLALASSPWSTALVELFAASLIVTFIFFRVKERGWKRLTAPNVLIVFWIAYAIVVAASIVASPFPQASLGYLNKHWHALLFPIVYYCAVSIEKVKIIARIFVVSTAGAAIVCLAFFLSDGARYASSPFIGETTFMVLVVIAGILVATSANMRASPGTPHWITHLVAGTPLILAVFLSTQRTPVITLTVGVSALMAVFRPKALVPWAVAVVFLLLLSPHVLWLKLLWTAGGHLDDRSIVWTEGISLLPGLPLFGYGPDSYFRILPAGTAFLNRPPVSWHNDLMQTILDSGWIAGLAYAGLLGFLSVATARAAVRSKSSAQRTSLIGACVLIGILLCFSMISAVLSTTVLGVMFWISLGLIGNLTRKELQNEPAFTN